MTGADLYQSFYGRESLNSELFLRLNHADLPFLDAVMPVITFLGGSWLFPAYFLILLLLYLANRRLMPGRYLVVYAIATLFSLGAEDMLKEFFHVPRPPLALGMENVRVLVEVGSSYALPSGHAIFSFMTACVLGYGRGMKWKLPLFLFVALVGYSRIYVGVHYPLDVVAGAGVGVTCGLLAWKFCALGDAWYGKLMKRGG